MFEIPHFIELENEKNNPDMKNPHLDISGVQEPTQINVKKIDKDDKTKISSFFVPEEHNRLTLELIDRGYINEDDIQIFYYNDLFNKLLEENDFYKWLMYIVHYIVPRVVNKGVINYENECDKKNKFFLNQMI